MAFFVVYILEAHPSDLWQLPGNVRDQVVYASPKSFLERSALADSCVRKLNIELPALIDDFSNSTEIAYTAWPDRLYVIDREGRVAYRSKAGPFGFQPAELEEALKRIAADQAVSAVRPPPSGGPDRGRRRGDAAARRHGPSTATAGDGIGDPVRFPSVAGRKACLASAHFPAGGAAGTRSAGAAIRSGRPVGWQ